MKKLLLGFCMLLLAACNDPRHTEINPLPLFADGGILEAVELPLQGEVLPRCGSVHKEKEYVVLSNVFTRYLLSIYDLRTGKLSYASRRGRGPKELISASLHRDRAGRLMAFSANLKRGLVYDFGTDSLALTPLSFSNAKVNLFFPYLLLLNDSVFIGSGAGLAKNSDYLFSVVNLNSGKSKDYISYPDDGMEIPEKRIPFCKSIIYSSDMFLRPDRKKFVIQPQSNGLLGIYHLEEDYSITEDTTIVYFYARYKYYTGSSGSGAAKKRGQRRGFASRGVSVTQDKIYALWDMGRLGKGPVKAETSKWLLCYNWEGQPLRKYKASRPFSHYTVIGDSVIYAYSMLPEPALLKYTIPPHE